jgi:glutathione S-transferase
MLIDADLHDRSGESGKRDFAGYMAGKYGHDEARALQAPNRAAAILRALSRQFDRQRLAGRTFLVGNQMTALDIYWATFAVLIEPLEPELCPIPDELRAYYTLRDPAVRGAVSADLMRHRDYMYRHHLVTPLEL